MDLYLTWISSIRARAVFVLSAFVLCLSNVFAHDVGPLGVHVLDWHSSDISKVTSSRMSLRNLGIGFIDGGESEVVEIGERRCLRGGIFNFDVNDDLAFDIDETVTLEIEFELETSPGILTIAYDKSGEAGGIIPFSLPQQSSSRFHTVQIELERARLAGRGDFGTDILITANPNPLLSNRKSPKLEVQKSQRSDVRAMTICGFRVHREFKAQPIDEYGWLELSIHDELARLTPARLGLYDESGRTPLPANSALEVQEFDDRTRSIYLQQEPGSANWPSDNRWVFYTDGNYRARLPAGEYSLVVSRGIEYQIEQRSIQIEPAKTNRLVIGMERWANLPEQGWYSGDTHIHTAQRDRNDSETILSNARAEDLHVVNSLEMGNMGTTHFPQLTWDDYKWFGTDTYAVVPGQEDPRTAIRGHTIHLDIPQPVRDPSRYLLYHEVFERVGEMGGISGYAHIGGLAGTLGGMTGLALDAPFGIIDFVEILQAGGLGTDLWFDFLNLGYEISPAAGSDYPYAGHIGEVRSYVKMPNGFSRDAWYDNLAAGHTFVTNGPVLDFELNGSGIGGHVALASGDSISIRAHASLNSDIDLLERLELIEQGEVVAQAVSSSGAESLQIDYENIAAHGTWFVIRASGKTVSETPSLGFRTVEAVSAPIYVSVDGQRTWKKDAVQTIATRQIDRLNTFATANASPTVGAEAWDDAALLSEDWSRQMALLRSRIVDAIAEYEELIELAK